MVLTERTGEINITSQLYGYSGSSGQVATYTHTNTNYTEALLLTNFQLQSATPTNCSSRYIGTAQTDWGKYYFWLFENLQNGSSVACKVAQSGGTGFVVMGIKNINFD